MYSIRFEQTPSNLKTIHDHIAKLIAKHLQQEITAEETYVLEHWIEESVQNMIQLEQLTSGNPL